MIYEKLFKEEDILCIWNMLYLSRESQYVDPSRLWAYQVRPKFYYETNC